MDVWVASVAAFGILGGLVAVWWLVRGKQRFVVERDWHFWVKQVWKHSTNWKRVKANKP
jgi:ATP-binding cassette, subfamily C (CFTR/MRP), member 1